MESWSPAVHGLLRYLESIDFPAPRVLHAEDGIETLTWIEGESGPDGRAKVVPESGLRRWARFLRGYHDAVAGHRPPADSVCSGGTGAARPMTSSAMVTSARGMVYGEASMWPG